jgi:hypothetical protein
MVATRLLVCFVVIVSATMCSADMTVKVRTVFHDSGAAPNVENPTVHSIVYYRHKEMRRKEEGPPGDISVTSIADCTTRTGFLIDTASREYRSYKLVTFWSEPQLQDYLRKNPSKAVQIESNTVDTGETQTFFGYQARHFVTTNRRQTHDEKAEEETLDGWYIELEPVDNDCAPDYVHRDPYYVFGTGLVMYPKIANFNHSGPVPTGWAVRLTLKERYTTGRTVTMERTVEDISNAALPESLFKVPPGFRKNPKLWRTHSPLSPIEMILIAAAVTAVVVLLVRKVKKSRTGMA